MSALIIWIDSVEAKLFEIEKDSIKAERVLFHGPTHQKEVMGKNHNRNDSDEEVFYIQLLEKLKTKDAKQILLMGPSLGATHFNTFLARTATEIFQRVIGTEKVDRMPDSEILSVGRKHLQKYYLYHAV